MSSFEIPDGPASIKLARGATPQDPLTGSAVYAVTNKSAAPISGRVGVQVTGDSKSDWFIVEGERERSFAPGETQTINLTLKVPPETPPGEHKFRLRVVAVNDPDNDHMESPIGTVSVEAAPSPTSPRFPWWILAVAAAVLAVIIFVITAFVWPGFLAGPKAAPTPTPSPTPSMTASAPALPPFKEADLKDKPFAFAEGFLRALGYAPKTLAAPSATGLAPGNVVSATLSTDAGEAPNTVIILRDPGVALPDFVGSSPAAATSLASGKVEVTYCKPNSAYGPFTGKVTAQSPTYPGQVARGSPVRLTLPTTEDVPLCRVRRPFASATRLSPGVLEAEGARFANQYKKKLDF